MSSLLVVDDNAGIRSIFVDHLGQYDLNVFEAATPDEALDYLENKEIHLTILDGELEIGCGWDTLRFIKNDENWPEMPIIFTSIYSDPECALRAWSYSNGVGIWYVVKPFSVANICSLIGEILCLD